MDNRKVSDAIDELTRCEIRYGLSDRLVTFTKTLDKNIEKFEAVARKVTQEKFSFTLYLYSQSQFWNQFNNTNKKYRSFKTVTFQRNCCLFEQFFFLKVFFSVITEMKYQINTKLRRFELQYFFGSCF